MTNSEHPPTNSLSSEEFIRDLLNDRDTEPTYYQNTIYSTIIDALANEGKSFDEIRARIAELSMPGAETIEIAENYQLLVDELDEGRPIEFQRNDGHFYPGTIAGRSKLRIDIDIAQSKTVAVLEVPIDYDDELDYIPFYPRRSPESGEMILPGLKLD